MSPPPPLWASSMLPRLVADAVPTSIHWSRAKTELRGRALKREVTEGSVVADPGDSNTFFVSLDFVFAKGLEGSQPFVHGSG